MISDALPKWIVAIVIFLDAVHPQMPMMPMGFGYGGPMMMPPPPLAIPVPVGIPIPYPESTSTTTTTQSYKDNGDNGFPIAIPIPVPNFVQFGIAGFMQCTTNNNKNNGNDNGNENKDSNKNCPPCPPCSCNPCTPSFFSFCSPCHLECRCKNGKENPTPQDPNNIPRPLPGPAFPMPIPMPAPGPVVIVPFPQFPPRSRPRPKPHSNSDSRSTTDSCEESKPYDSRESSYSRRKRKRKRGKSKNRNRKSKSNYDIYRRNFGFMRNRSDKREGLIEPVLTYMTSNGDIKMERHLSNDEARALLGGRRSYSNLEAYDRADDTYNNVHLVAGEDSNNRPRVVVRSEPGVRSNYRRRQELLFGKPQHPLGDGKSQHLLGDGKKELVFKTPENKKISNLSVSFQISK